ncbi:hypothetical protein XELAEV_18000145mg, partial [Xenopus laevis]
TWINFLGQPATKPQRPNRTKPKDNKKSTEQMEVESDSQHSQVDNPTTAELLLDQKLAPIKESLTEVLQQVTHHSQRLMEAEDRISTLEDDLDKAQNTIDTQQKEIIILANK